MRSFLQRDTTVVTPVTTASLKQHQQQATQLAELRQLDEQGWSTLHHAAFRGYVKSLDRFLRLAEHFEAEAAERRRKQIPLRSSTTARRITLFDEEEQLRQQQQQVRLVELTTGDKMKFTPLHLAVIGGHLEAVECLIDNHDARIDAKNDHGHGPIELAALERHIKVLDYFATRRVEAPIDASVSEQNDAGEGSAVSDSTSSATAVAVDVWNRLAELLRSNVDKEAEAAAESILGLLLLHSSSLFAATDNSAVGLTFFASFERVFSSS